MRKFACIVIASLNRGKQEEFVELFQKHAIKVSAPEVYIRNASFLQSVEEHHPGATYRDNVDKKCRALFQAAKVPTLADDSGLEVDAIMGQPGVHSAHFATEKKAAESQDAANRRKLLDMLKGKSDRKARFRSVLAFQVEGVMMHAEGVCEGQIATEERGTNGFGYDALFIPDGGNGKTFAELSAEEKNAFSHRAKAVQDLVHKLRERSIEFVRP